jgi:DNA gyrase subunit A
MKINPNIKIADIVSEMKENYISYAEYVIRDRALPDIRDGLKPVHRRILWAMWQLGSKHNTNYKKSARIVGDTLGKFHPHGDASVYLAMVRLAQDFITSNPLVDGKGNFGGMDGTPAAAQRYTEARLSKFAEKVYFSDINEDVVEFVSNYAGDEIEPVVLPAKA